MPCKEPQLNHVALVSTPTKLVFCLQAQAPYCPFHYAAPTTNKPRSAQSGNHALSAGQFPMRNQPAHKRKANAQAYHPRDPLCVTPCQRMQPSSPMQSHASWLCVSQQRILLAAWTSLQASRLADKPSDRRTSLLHNGRARQHCTNLSSSPI